MPAPTPPDAPIPVPTPPDRTDKSTFVSRSFIFTNWYIPFQAWLVTVVTYITESITWIAGLATAAEASATSAAASALSASSVSNYKGEWSSLTGALNKPATVSNDGAFWALNNNLADVTASEPALGNADWTFISGTRWVTQFTGSATLPANALCSIAATAATSNMTLGAFVANDFFVLAVSPTTTQTVRVLNPSHTIIGRRRTATAGNDITIPPGGFLQLRAISATVLEMYSNG